MNRATRRAVARRDPDGLTSAVKVRVRDGLVRLTLRGAPGAAAIPPDDIDTLVVLLQEAQRVARGATP